MFLSLNVLVEDSRRECLKPQSPYSLIVRVVISSLSLTISQWYAFFLLSQLSFIIFPPVYGVIVFAIGFFGRIIGSLVFGYIGDKVGRRVSLLLTSLILALSPIPVLVDYNYYSVVLLRLLQGLSLGGEWGGASTLMVEKYSESVHRGFIASTIQLAVPISVLLSSISLYFSLADWRYYLLIDSLLALLSTPFIEETGVSPSLTKNKEWGNVLKAIGIKVSESANFYIFTSLVYAYVKGASLLVSLAISLQFVFLPLFGYLTDVIGRKNVVFIGVVLMALGSYLFKSEVGEIILSISDSALYAPQSSIFTEIFDRRHRVTASNFSYQTASVIGGFLAPALLRLTNSNVMLVTLPYLAVTTVSTLLITETKGKKI